MPRRHSRRIRVAGWRPTGTFWISAGLFNLHRADCPCTSGLGLGWGLQLTVFMSSCEWNEGKHVQTSKVPCLRLGSIPVPLAVEVGTLTIELLRFKKVEVLSGLTQFNIQPASFTYLSQSFNLNVKCFTMSLTFSSGNQLLEKKSAKIIYFSKFISKQKVTIWIDL